jgi:hypothetical protein
VRSRSVPQLSQATFQQNGSVAQRLLRQCVVIRQYGVMQTERMSSSSRSNMKTIHEEMTITRMQ